MRWGCVFGDFKGLVQEYLFLLHTIQPDTSPNPGIQFSGKFFAERADAQLSCQLRWTQLRRVTSPGSRSLVQISLPEDEHDVLGSLALGNPARSQCASKVHKVNYNSFHSKKVNLTIFQELPDMAKWSTWVFPFRSPCSTAG